MSAVLSEDACPFPPYVDESAKTAGCARPQAALEDFPRLVQKIELMWRTPELDVFLRHLMLDSRDGARQGFPLSVAEELMFLAEANRVVRTFDTAKRLGVNWPEAYRLISEGDEASLKNDLLDDPSVSSETSRPVVRRADRARSSTVPSEEQSDDRYALAAKLILNKWSLSTIAVLFAAGFLLR